MSKFKVGEKVRRINMDWPGVKSFKVGDIGIIVCNENPDGLINYYSVERESDSFVFESNDGKNLELVSPKPEPLKNTIIVNITSPEQHKRVQEKLFGMGNTRIGCGGMKYFNTVKVYCDGTIDSFDKKDISNYDDPIYRHIPASGFLGEEESTPKMRFVSAGSCLPNFEEIDRARRFRDLDNTINKILNNPSTSPRTGKGTNIMNSVCGQAMACGNGIVNFAKDLLLSADEKLLRKMGLHDSCGCRTTEARELIDEKLREDNEPYLLEIAKAKEADEKANK